MTDRYAVIGNPISHSRSPEIHQAFARQTGRKIEFDRLFAMREEFEHVLEQFVNERGKGLSVTMPFKQRAYKVADTLSERARKALAVNTLVIDKSGKIFGDNTDGPGLVKDIIVNLGWQIRGKKVLLLGAGGAARGILESLSGEAPSALRIANRTESKAQLLATEFPHQGEVSASSIEQLVEPYDLVINATAASLQGFNLEIPAVAISDHTHCYDLAYAAEETHFNRWAASKGACRTSDGLGMLVEQAALAFFLWQGVLPETLPVIVEIRQLMSNG